MISKSSNLIILGNTTDIMFNQLSGYNVDVFDSFKRNYKNPNSPTLRRKLFGMYNYTKSFISQASSTPALEVMNLLKTIIYGFYSSDIDSLRKNFNIIEQNRLDELELRCKNILKRMFNTDNVMLVFDTTKEKKPIKVYLDYDHNENNLKGDPLDFTWKNGFYKLVNTDGICVSIFISTEYIRELLNLNYKEIKSIVENSENPSDTEKPKNEDQILQLGENYSINLTEVLNRFWKDFLSAFTIALYVDRYRENIYSQIYTIIKIMDKEKNYKYQSSYQNSPKMFDDMIEKYKNDIIKTKLNIENEKSLPEELKPALCEALYEVCNNLMFTKVNPIDLYETLFNPLTSEINTVKDKLKLVNLNTNIENFAYVDSKLGDLNEDFGNTNANLLASTILIKRLVPIIIIAEFIIGDGEKYSTVKNILDKMAKRLVSMNFATSNSPATKYLGKIIDNINNVIYLLTKHLNILVDSKRIKYIFLNMAYNRNMLEEDLDNNSDRFNEIMDENQEEAKEIPII